MKKVFIFVLLLGLLTFCVTCTGMGPADAAGTGSRKSLKILFIGHSTVQDEVTYAPFILDSIAPELDLTVGIAYRANTNIRGEDGFNAMFGDPLRKLSIFSLYVPHARSWLNSEKYTVTLQEALDFRPWDVVVVNETINYYNDDEITHYAVVGEFLDKIVNYVNRPLKFGFFVNHNRFAKNNMIEIVETPQTYYKYWSQVQQYVLNVFPIDYCFPNLTAYYNARGTVLDRYGSAPWHHMLADGTHYQEGIGCMVGGYTTALKILEIAGIHDKSVLGDKTRPNLRWVINKNIPGRNLGRFSAVTGISDKNCLIAQQCAVMAVKNPTEISVIFQQHFRKNDL